MEYVTNQTLNVPVRGTVEQAAGLIETLIERESREHGRLEALLVVSRRCGLPHGLVRSLFQPSRRPKTIPSVFWTKLVDAYLRFCRQQMAELEHDIARVQALGDDGHRAAALSAQVERLAAALKPLL